ncbi:Lsr2 family DNA-binding protein [Streptomyces monomycini]|uniref:Lsr2 family DNA-binding protein n=1 Tax=Streptomyces monomycini TaxID=371720 RepID=UPI0004AA10E7|nr:histone-like nucleoid-structuring protein Lsr2 [Streptomyces monomycini]
MFTDMREALDAESLDLAPPGADQQAAAARTVARLATSTEDLVLLLDAIGLPGDDATLATLLPLLPRCKGDTDMPQPQPTPAPKSPTTFEAMALSMYYADASAAEITAATGLSEDEVTTLVNAQEAKTEVMLDADEQTRTGSTPLPEADDPVEQLLAWAEAHPAAGIRAKAVRVRSDLADLTARRAADAAQRKAEERVARLKAELERAQEQLRVVKAGSRPASTAPAAEPTPIRAGLGSGRAPQELTAIRTWARANGHVVADKGMVPKAVLAAYDAAHQAPDRKAG